MGLLNRFKQNWVTKAFAPEDATILLAVSGGVDSMVMANLFFESKLSIVIAHCNFQLRGEDANLDEQLVKEWAENREIPFHSIRFDTKDKSEEWKKGIQETARILRYQWFESTRQEIGAYCIATAHHANDNAETLLMNLFKGTGISGLHAIPERNDKIVRPLLFAHKKELSEYAGDKNILFREDASNATDNYLRNAVRNNLIPLSEKWFPNIIQHLNDNVQRFSEAEIIYQRAIEQERKKLVEKRGNDWYIPVLKLLNRDPLQTICYELFKPFGYTSTQVPQIVQLISSVSGHYIENDSFRITKDRNFLIITSVMTEKNDFITIEDAPCAVNVSNCSLSFQFEKAPKSIPSFGNIAYIDAGKISFPLILRKWRAGDYFYPIGMGMKKKKLSNFFIDLKLPVPEKERIWVLESQKRIIWIAGKRLDERFKISQNTEQVLRVEMTPF